jgi:hypothetical protein
MCARVKNDKRNPSMRTQPALNFGGACAASKKRCNAAASTSTTTLCVAGGSIDADDVFPFSFSFFDTSPSSSTLRGLERKRNPLGLLGVTVVVVAVLFVVKNDLVVFAVVVVDVGVVVSAAGFDIDASTRVTSAKNRRVAGLR